MSKLSKIATSIFTVIGLSVSSYSFADDIGSVLKNRIEFHISIQSRSLAAKQRFSHNPWSIQDIVENQIKSSGTMNIVNSKTAARMIDPSSNALPEALGRSSKL